MRVATILLVGADQSAASLVHDIVDETEHVRLEEADGANAALRRLQRGGVHLILASVPDPAAEKGVTGLLRAATASPTRVSAIVLCEQKNAQLRCRLLRAGAVDCMSRPFDPARLALLVDVLTVRARYQQQPGPKDEASSLAAGEPVGGGFALGTSVMGDFMERLHLVAPLDTTILITGETGTGKTHLARMIHEISPRKERPFVAVPCGALSATLIESEMFGHVRGAFTHADRDRVGKFSHVEDGTLLLDEVDCVPLEAQAKLLRAFEERVFEPVGSNESKRFRGRLLVASNRPLEKEVEAGRFRSDLYYRLNVVEFVVPPLRERLPMIRPLAERFLAQFSRYDHRPFEALTSAAMTALEAYDWPGNVRELRNVVERSVALCPERTIDVGNLPEKIRGGRATLQMVPDLAAVVRRSNGLAEARSNAEKGRLLQALRHNNNNRSSTAVELGVSRVTLYKKLHRYGLV